LKFKTHVNALVRAMGKSVAHDTKAALHKSLKRMQHASVGVILSDGSEYHVSMLPEYYVKPDDTVLINMDYYFQRMFVKKMVTHIDTRFRATLRGDVTKRLYSYFQRHWRANKPYHIRIRKLAKYINLDTEGKPLWKIRQQIIKGLQELHEKDYLKSWSLADKKRQVHMIFHGVKHTEITEESLEQSRSAEEYEGHYEPKRAKYKKKLKEREKDVPDGVCPHGREFGQHDSFYLKCEYCGRADKCSQIKDKITMA
jgi:hypothetical protein